MSNNEKIEITSFLFSTVSTRSWSDRFAERSDEHIVRTAYNHEIPALEYVDLSDGKRKCIFDFTTCLKQGLVYHAAISDFLTSYERFLCDVLVLGDDHRFELSAAISVASDLVVFEMRSPRVPVSVSKFSTFQFNYWVWHVRPD